MKNTAGVNPGEVLSSAGATNLHSSFSGKTLETVLHSYLDGLHTAYALAIASAGIAFLLGLASEWKKVNMEQVIKQQGAAADESQTEKTDN